MAESGVGPDRGLCSRHLAPESWLLTPEPEATRQARALRGRIDCVGPALVAGPDWVADSNQRPRDKLGPYGEERIV